MASRTSSRRSSSSYPERSGGRFLAFVLGIVFTFAVLLGGGWLYLRYGHPPVAAADPAFPMEAQIVHVPLNARIAREVQQPPFGTSEDVFESGAKLYVNQCAGCHGVPGKDADFAKWMYPSAPQLWKKHARGNVVGVSDDEPGETFWKIRNGIRLTGMPAYQHILTPTQMWQIALLLKNADQPLPNPVKNLLTQ
jgi:mono/diheme cytochrome c family protein